MREQTSAAGHNPTTVSLSTLIISCRRGGGGGGRYEMNSEGQKETHEENHKKQKWQEKEIKDEERRWTDEEEKKTVNLSGWTLQSFISCLCTKLCTNDRVRNILTVLERHRHVRDVAPQHFFRLKFLFYAEDTVLIIMLGSVTKYT